MFKTPFKPTGHYVFDYKPRYFDERKERLQSIEDKYHKTASKDGETDYKVSLTRNNLKNEWCRTRSSAKEDYKTTYRLALIITILVGIAIYILR
ncbi:hypothetical protein N9901_00995 [Flavobacteriaceae bacterium]|nr:hypothetical protein [Flavobacteriaceae bacterium]